MSSVAAIIPTIGRDELRLAVESVNLQTQPVRAIVVLDRPALKSEVNDSLRGLEYQLVLTAGGERGGRARNLGVQHAAAYDFVAFLDDDDQWEPDKTRLQLLASEDHAGAVITCLSSLCGARSRTVPEVAFDGRQSMATYLLDRSTITLRRHFMQTSSLLLPTGVANRFPWDASLGRHQDWDLLIRMQRAGTSFITVPEVLVTVLQGSQESVSQSNAWEISLEWLETVRHDASRRSTGDFLASIAMRGALANGDTRAAVRLTIGAVRLGAHPAAIAVGLSGVLNRIRRGVK